MWYRRHRNAGSWIAPCNALSISVDIVRRSERHHPFESDIARRLTIHGTTQVVDALINRRNAPSNRCFPLLRNFFHVARGSTVETID